jgi:hypothetical protein
MKFFNVVIISASLFACIYAMSYLYWRQARGLLMPCGSLVVTSKGDRLLSKFEFYGFYPAILLEQKLFHYSGFPLSMQVAE